MRPIGNCSGCCDGSGYGNVDHYGSGDGSGHGNYGGCGYGDGDGDGRGYGYGDGHGYGDTRHNGDKFVDTGTISGHRRRRRQ